MSARRADCPECGKPMTWDPEMSAWDCGPEDEGGHGFWNPESVYASAAEAPAFDAFDEWCRQNGEPVTNDLGEVVDVLEVER